jgi:LysR family glycine cleavage system transcriptional activator
MRTADRHKPTLVDFGSQPIDVGIRYGTGVWPRLVAAPFARDAFFPVCSPSLLEREHPLRSPADLRHHQLIHDTSMATTTAFRTWRNWYAKAGLPIEGSERGLRVNDSAAVYRMVISGNGVALGRTTLVQRDLSSTFRNFVPIGGQVITQRMSSIGGEA